MCCLWLHLQAAKINFSIKECYIHSPKVKMVSFGFLSPTFFLTLAFHFFCTSVHDMPVLPCLTAFFIEETTAFLTLY